MKPRKREETEWFVIGKKGIFGLYVVGTKSYNKYDFLLHTREF